MDNFKDFHLVQDLKFDILKLRKALKEVLDLEKPYEKISEKQ